VTGTTLTIAFGGIGPTFRARLVVQPLPLLIARKQRFGGGCSALRFDKALHQFLGCHYYDAL